VEKIFFPFKLNHWSQLKSYQKKGFASYRTIKKPFWTIKQEGCLSSISIDLTSTLQELKELKESVQYKVPILLAYKNTLNSLFF